MILPDITGKFLLVVELIENSEFMAIIAQNQPHKLHIVIDVVSSTKPICFYNLLLISQQIKTTLAQKIIEIHAPNKHKKLISAVLQNDKIDLMKKNKVSACNTQAQLMLFFYSEVFAFLTWQYKIR